MQSPNQLYIAGKELAGLEHIHGYMPEVDRLAVIDDLQRVGRDRLERSSWGTFLLLDRDRFPQSVQQVASRLVDDRLIGAVDFLQVNYYNPGRGIPAHVDAPGVGQNAVVTLQSSAVIGFAETKTSEPCTHVLLRPGDVYTIRGIARHYAHGILHGSVDWFRAQPYPRAGQRIAAAFVAKAY